eukprot:650962-Pyramimonas_sp.AAC.1
MSDPAEFEERAPPFQCLFWWASLVGDRELEDSVAHMCPIFDEEAIGTSISNLTVDVLHAIFFGPVQRVASAMLWRLALASPWR